MTLPIHYVLLNDLKIQMNSYAFIVFAPETKVEPLNVFMARDPREIGALAPLGTLRERTP
jgi:hypothetical protein